MPKVSKSQKDNDLSQYELQRLENIKRNEKFLASLGAVFASILFILTFIITTCTFSGISACNLRDISACNQWAGLASVKQDIQQTVTEQNHVNEESRKRKRDIATLRTSKPSTSKGIESGLREPPRRSSRLCAPYKVEKDITNRLDEDPEDVTPGYECMPVVSARTVYDGIHICMTNSLS